MQTPKNSGVAGSIKSTPYSIGYVELAYAIQNNFTYASVKNAAGNFVVPSLDHGGRRRRPEDQRHADRLLHRQRSREPTAIPISGYSWAILLQKQTSATTGGGDGEGARLDRPTPVVARTWPPASTTWRCRPAVQNQVRTALLDGDRVRAGRCCSPSDPGHRPTRGGSGRPCDHD